MFDFLWTLGIIGLFFSFNWNLERKKEPIFNPLSANPIKWSNTLKQFVSKLPTNCLSVFDHFVLLAMKGLTNVPLQYSLKTMFFRGYRKGTLVGNGLVA